jgi:hypothetical protein
MKRVSPSPSFLPKAQEEWGNALNSNFEDLGQGSIKNLGTQEGRRRLVTVVLSISEDAVGG